MKKDYTTRALALGYMFLGGYYLSDKALLSHQTIAGLSITALCFVLSDVAKVYSEKFSKWHVIYKGLQRLAICLHRLGFVVAIVVPYVILEKFDFTDEYYGVIGTGVSLISLGLSIYIMAKRNEKQEE